MLLNLPGIISRAPIYGFSPLRAKNQIPSFPTNDQLSAQLLPQLTLSQTPNSVLPKKLSAERPTIALADYEPNNKFRSS